MKNILTSVSGTRSASNQANGGFIDNSALPSQPLDLSLQIAGVGDFNGDHQADVLVQWSDGSLQVWTGSSSGAILSPIEKQWEDAFAGAQAFMAERGAAMAEVAGAMAQVAAAEINAAVQSIHGMPTPQIDDMSGEMAAATADMWYMANPSQWPNTDPAPDPAWAQIRADLNSFLAGADGSGLQISLFDSGGFWASFGGNSESLTPIDQANGIFDVNFNGMDFIANWTGGDGFAPPDPNSIVVTGMRPLPMLFMPSGFDVSYAENHYNPFDGFGGMGGGGAAPYFFGASADANAFANQHVNNAGSTAADQHDFKLAHDGLAKFYDWAKANPNAQIDIGENTFISASQALLDLGSVTINITDTGGGPWGAQTAPTQGYLSALIEINPQNANVVGYATSYGDAGINYVIFHEIGHALDAFTSPILYNDPLTEASANTAGRSIENDLLIPLMEAPPGTVAYD